METRGERLKRLRNDKGLSQQKLAELVKVTKANVSKWESKASPNIDLDVFFALAALFDIDPVELATGKSAKPIKHPDIPQRRLDLIRAYGRLPEELRFPIRSMIETLATAHDQRYQGWVEKEAEFARKRDSKKAPA